MNGNSVNGNCVQVTIHRIWGMVISAKWEYVGRKQSLVCGYLVLMWLNYMVGPSESGCHSWCCHNTVPISLFHQLEPNPIKIPA